ncbi:MAG: 1-deoxy-D-xylulose-5-phosphate reductoisomerase [Nitrospirota bacterium]|nr:1-deoxy-D-xylulose-5-phosphate reductoisomerase [Nitrospirota bacterium]
MKRLSILGSTGSIGQNTLDVVSRRREEFSVVALVAGRNIALLEKQINAFNPEIVAVADKDTADSLSKRINGTEILSGADGVNHVASYKNADFVVSAISGAAGLIPTLSAVRAGKNIGLANKESLVMAGAIVREEAQKSGSMIIPVDSEHCAVFQCLEGRRKGDVKKIILTASGGPFVDRSSAELRNITAKDALKHPNWSMGKKISIDSATLMNKGLEVIEACWLFDMSAENIDVLIHPQSIVHSMVEFKDSSCLAQMSVPDMRGPIAYALSYPEMPDAPIPGLELDRIGSLTFRKPDLEKFPCLSYAYEAFSAGGTMPCVLNASNEVAVHAFLAGGIGFNDIHVIIRKTINSHDIIPEPSLDDILETDGWARNKAKKYLKELDK